jgi:hypothetical protein
MKTARTIGATLALAGLVFLLGCATVYDEKFQFSANLRRAEGVQVTPGPAAGDGKYLHLETCEDSAIAKRATGLAAPYGLAPEAAAGHICPREGCDLSRRNAEQVRTAKIPVTPHIKRARGPKTSDSIEELIRWLG